MKNTDRNKAVQFFINVRWPDGIRCPMCESSNISDHRLSLAPSSQFYCKGCKRAFSVSRNTIMENSHCNSLDWFYIFQLYFTSEDTVDDMVNKLIKITRKKKEVITKNTQRIAHSILNGGDVLVYRLSKIPAKKWENMVLPDMKVNSANLPTHFSKSWHFNKVRGFEKMITGSINPPDPGIVNTEMKELTDNKIIDNKITNNKIAYSIDDFHKIIQELEDEKIAIDKRINAYKLVLSEMGSDNG